MNTAAPGSARTPATRTLTRPRLAVVAVIIAALAIGIVAAPPIRYAIVQPNVSMVGADVTIWYCRPGPVAPIPPQFYRFDFRLQNTGDADGYARVDFIVNGSEIGRGIYVVPASQVVNGNATFGVADCDLYATGSVFVHNFWKA